MEEIKEVVDTKEIRIARCKKRVEDVLKEENCGIEAMMILKAGQVIPQISIVDVPEKEEAVTNN